MCSDEDILKTSANTHINNEKTNKEKFSNSGIKNDKMNKEKFLLLINNIIYQIIEENQKERKISKNMSAMKSSFYMKNPPNITYIEYLKRINKYLNPSKTIFLIALLYIDKICSTKWENFLVENNIFKVLLIAIMISFKFNQDFIENNEFFAKVGGISLKEINELEIEFCYLIDYRFFVSSDVYKEYEKYLIFN